MILLLNIDNYIIMDDLINSMNKMHVEENVMIEYVKNLQIDENIKKTLIEFIYNDNYNSYINIYNICLENDIELPPI
uniref:Uncharacterized protein n=1 Tax=viral metagenome TaxID=1070528 RepID=A0A6C0J2I8_9ZZZZ